MPDYEHLYFQLLQYLVDARDICGEAVDLDDKRRLELLEDERAIKRKNIQKQIPIKTKEHYE